MITPSDTPSSPSNYASVPVQGMDIQAPSPADAVTAAFNTANDLGGSGVLYPMSERIQQAKTLLESPAGFGSDGFDVDGGWHGDWPADVEPDVAGP